MIKATHRVSHNVATVYRDDNYGSEHISQVLWGSGVQKADESGEFSRIICEDLYEGWIRSAYLAPIIDDSDSAISTVAAMFAELYSSPDPSSELITRLTAGSRIVLSRKSTIGHYVPVELPNGSTGYIHAGNISYTYRTGFANGVDLRQETAIPGVDIIDYLLNRVAISSVLFIGVPYLWGGTTPFGLDCSGFTQLVYRVNGIQLLRDAVLQWRDKRFVDVLSEPGLAGTPFERADLLFFSSKPEIPGSITHVGLALGNGRFIHSVGKGRGNIITDCRDDEFTTTFIGARRLTAANGLSVYSA